MTSRLSSDRLLFLSTIALVVFAERKICVGLTLKLAADAGRLIAVASATNIAHVKNRDPETMTLA